MNTRNLIIKIDVRGAEPLIFQGMKRILKEIAPLIIFEFIPWVCKSIEQDPVSFLQGFPKGYKLYEVNEQSAKLEEISKHDAFKFVKKLSARDLPYTDLLLVHDKNCIDSIDLETLQ